MTEPKPVYIPYQQVFNTNMAISLEEQHLLLRLRQLSNEVIKVGKPVVLGLIIDTDGGITWCEQ